MPKLGKTQKAVYEFICIYIEENFIPPTVREIGAAVGLKSTSTVHMHLQNLAAKGLIILTPSKQRSITLPKSAAPVSAMSGMSIPLVGSVAAGQPILAEENIQDYLSVPESFLRGRRPGEVFALNVQGESMIEIGIRDGDTLIVDKETEVFEGDDAVAQFRARIQESKIERFCKLDDHQMPVAQMRIREKLISDMPNRNNFNRATDEMGVLLHELNKKRKKKKKRKKSQNSFLS